MNVYTGQNKNINDIYLKLYPFQHFSFGLLNAFMQYATNYPHWADLFVLFVNRKNSSIN